MCGLRGLPTAASQAASSVKWAVCCLHHRQAWPAIQKTAPSPEGEPCARGRVLFHEPTLVPLRGAGRGGKTTLRPGPPSLPAATPAAGPGRTLTPRPPLGVPVLERSGRWACSSEAGRPGSLEQCATAGPPEGAPSTEAKPSCPAQEGTGLATASGGHPASFTHVGPARSSVPGPGKVLSNSAVHGGVEQPEGRAAPQKPLEQG